MPTAVEFDGILKSAWNFGYIHGVFILEHRYDCSICRAKWERRERREAFCAFFKVFGGRLEAA